MKTARWQNATLAMLVIWAGMVDAQTGSAPSAQEAARVSTPPDDSVPPSASSGLPAMSPVTEPPKPYTPALSPPSGQPPMLEPAGTGAPGLFPADKPIALVNGEAVTQSEVDAVLKNRPAPSSDSQLRQMRLEVVGTLIDDHLMQQYLRAHGPRVQETDIARWLSQLEANLKSQGHTLQEFYKERGLSEEQLRHSVSSMLQWAGYVKIQLSEEELKKYFEMNREFFDQVSVRASHIMLRVPPTATPADRQALAAKLQTLRQDIIAGKVDFVEAAKKNSQCPSAPSGGDVGFFPRKFAFEENFTRAAFALKVGEVSDVVETNYGLHLIKLTDRKPGQPTDYAKMKDEVREAATHEMYLKLLAQLRREARVEILGGADGDKRIQNPEVRSQNR